MPDRASFHQAIRNAPEDLALRLVYADWLEEQGDPLADFIRLQCRLESPPDNEGDARALRRRANEMLQAYRPTWLGPLAALEKRWHHHTRFHFRRGLVEAASLRAGLFLEEADAIAQWCPALHRLTLFEACDEGPNLADCPHLALARHLELGDWITGADAQALAASPHTVRLLSIKLWLGGHDSEVCQTLAAPQGFPGLRELCLVQLHGGIEAGEEADAERLDALADGLAEQVNRLRGGSVARVERPFARLFPIAPQPGYGLRAGRLPGKRQGLVAVQWNGLYLVLTTFDAEGTFLEEHRRDLIGTLVPEPEPGWAYDHNEELMAHLRSEFEFEPALIHVKEFNGDEGASVSPFSGPCLDLILPDPEDSLFDDIYADDAAMLHEWLESGSFVIEWGNDYYAGPDGMIYSS